MPCFKAEGETTMQAMDWIGKMLSKKRTAVAAAMLTVALLSGWMLEGCSSQGKASAAFTQSNAPVPVEAVKVTSRKLELMIHLPGELQPYEQVRVFPRVSGFVKSISVDRGSMVHRGQLIAILSAPEITAQKAESQAKLLSAENQRIVGEAKLAADQSTYQRLKNAAQTPGVISDEELDTAEKTAEGDYARVIALRNTAEAARANLRSAAEMEGYLRITAPFDGVVTKRNVHPGALVGPAGASGSQPSMLRIEQVAHLRLVVAVPENYVAGVEPGSVVSFTVPAFPGRVFHGTIARLADSLDVSTRTMPVEMDVKNPKSELYSGMFPDVQWRVSRTEPVLVVPSTAIGRSMDQSFVMRIHNGQVEQVIVKTGGTEGGMTEVFGSLQEGDVIARQITDDLHPGVSVDPRLAM
jgi:RND family efflux transporter MFP subunit